jgi:hypothetical protein
MSWRHVVINAQRIQCFGFQSLVNTPISFNLIFHLGFRDASFHVIFIEEDSIVALCVAALCGLLEWLSISRRDLILL